MLKNTKNISLYIITLLILVTATLAVLVPVGVSAITCPDGSFLPDAEANNCPPASGSSSTGDGNYIEADCQGENIQAGQTGENSCRILDYLVLFINVLSGLVGIIVVGSIIFAGIQYSTSGGDPSKVSAAKDRIRNAVIALVFFIFMYGFLDYLVPGGVLR